MITCENHLLHVDNGSLSFDVLLDNGADIADIMLNGVKMSWDRSKKYLVNPDNVDLKKDGWDKGFYAAVASLGPEVFGTPDETCTAHGTASYSKADLSTLRTAVGEQAISIEVTVLIKGYDREPKYKKRVYITLENETNLIIRREVYENLTEERLPLDDGYHVQFSGEFAKAGGRYVLPVPDDQMLLRDSAPIEADKKAFPAYDQEYLPIRCYQYVPQKVFGLESVGIFAKNSIVAANKDCQTAEMIVDNDRTHGAIVVRPLWAFPRTLLAKRNDDTAMYAIEPCKTRPNSLRQKAIDGELMYIEPKEEVESLIIFGFLSNHEEILRLEELIERSACYEKKLKEWSIQN